MTYAQFVICKYTREQVIYLDHNATTPCAPEVVAAMQRFWSEEFGNPASAHLAGRNAARAVAASRSKVASLINCRPNEIIFTSGATESNNLVFLGLLLSNRSEKKRIVTTAIEHKSVLEPMAFLAERGFDVVHLPVTRDGVVDLGAASKLISPETVLVSVQAANNEIGTLQPIEEISHIAHKAGAFFHTDAAQALGKIPVDMKTWGCDFASFSAHKLYGPKGVGAMFVGGGTRRWPWPYPLRGGSQEGGLRPGTTNVPAIVGFGEACSLATKNLTEEMSRVHQLRTVFEENILSRIPNCIIHAQKAPRLPGTISVAFNGIHADMLIDNLATVCIGKGSACSDGAIGVSHVLISIGCESNVADATIRLSLGRNSTHKEIDLTIDKIVNSVSILRDKFKGRSYVAE
jgi:cysteine desulfurase